MLEEREFCDADESGKPLKKRKYYKDKKYQINPIAAKHVIKAGWAKDETPKGKKARVTNTKARESRSENKSDQDGSAVA